MLDCSGDDIAPLDNAKHGLDLRRPPAITYRCQDHRHTRRFPLNTCVLNGDHRDEEHQGKPNTAARHFVSLSGHDTPLLDQTQAVDVV